MFHFRFRCASAHAIITENIIGSVTCFPSSEHVYFLNWLCGFQRASVDTFCTLENKIRSTSFAFNQDNIYSSSHIRDFTFILTDLAELGNVLNTFTFLRIKILLTTTQPSKIYIQNKNRLTPRYGAQRRIFKTERKPRLLTLIFQVPIIHMNGRIYLGRRITCFGKYGKKDA